MTATTEARDAGRTSDGVPGHAHTAAGALAFTELYPDECEGLVVTERSAA